MPRRLPLILAIVAVLGAGWWLVGLVREKDRLAGVERRALACEAAAKAGADTATNCSQAVSDGLTRGQRYLACDAALTARELYTVRAACSEAVKRRDAEATALAAERDQLAAQLADARRDAGAAIARAEARSTALLKRTRHAEAAIAAAPRGADGRVRCDDRCLRELTGH